MKLKDTQTCQADGLGAQHRQAAGGGRRGQVGLPVAVALRRHARHLGRAHLRGVHRGQLSPGGPRATKRNSNHNQVGVSLFSQSAIRTFIMAQ